MTLLQFQVEAAGECRELPYLVFAVVFKWRELKMCGKCFKLNGLTQFLIYGEGIEGYTACHILSCQIYVSDHFSHRYVFPGIQIITEGKSPHRNEDTKVLQSTAIG